MKKMFEKELEAIYVLRERKGEEEAAFKAVNDLLPRVQKARNWKILTKLYFESHLIWQHLAMNEMVKPGENRNLKLIQDSTEKMIEFANKALDVIHRHHIKSMEGLGHRFLGRGMTFKSDHKKAKECYQKAISKLYGENAKSKLEVSAFLFDAMIRLGDIKGGIKLAKKTYKDFHTSKIGKNLKKNDFFVWGVWMSGIAPRLLNALIEVRANFDKEEMATWLNEVKKELEDPSAEKKLAGKNFQYRLDELSLALTKIRVITLALTIGFYSLVRNRIF